MRKRSSACLAAFAAATAASHVLGGSFYYTWISELPSPAAIADDPNLANHQTFDLFVTTFGDWTAASLRVDLTGGTFYNSALGGDTTPLPAIVAAFPAAAYDTYVSSPSADGTNNVTQIFGGHGGGGAQLSGSTFSVHWGDSVTAPAGTSHIARLTFPINAMPSIGTGAFTSQTNPDRTIPILPTLGGPFPNDWLPDADGSWHDENNWLAGEPISMHSVKIDVGGDVVRTITYSQGETFVREIDSKEHILITGGSLRVAQSPFLFKISNGLTLSGGTLQADVTGSPVTVGPAGGTIRSTAITNGLIMHGGAPLIVERTTLDHGLWLGGVATLSPGATIRFSGSQDLRGASVGTFLLNGGGIANIDGGTTLTVLNAISFRGNGGTIGARTAGSPGIAALINHGHVMADVSGGSLTIAPDVFVNHGSLQASTGAALQINPNIDARAGAIGGDGVVRALGGLSVNGKIVKDGSGALRVGAPLTIAADKALDLQGGSIINDYSDTSPLTAIRARIVSGYNGGTWDGPGIQSSTAAATDGFAIGYAEASDIYSDFPAMFAGESIDDTTVLVRLTRSGDANLDGLVNLIDFNRLAANFNAAGLWTRGDFNYDGVVNLIDFNLLAANFGLTASPDGPTPQDWATLAAVIPEPSALVFSGVAASAAMFLRRRRGG